MGTDLETMEMTSGRQEIARLLAQERNAHLTANADLMVEPFADDFISVARGEISHPTRDESRKRFALYFGSVKFLAWDDITPPVIWISHDVTLATALIHKRVHIEFQDEDGTPAQDETTFVWQETYVYEKGRWWLKLVVSTNAPHTITKS